jgi:preprotein translocase subunit SecD
VTTSQRNRVYFIGALVAIALIVLAPTFFKNDLPEKWPGRPIKLGLDLRGGSYLVLGVQTEEAVKSQLGAMANAIRSELKNEKLGIIRAKPRDSRSIEIVMLLPEGDAGTANLNKLDKFIRENFADLTKLKVEKGESRATVVFQLKDQTAQDMKQNAVLQAIETIRNRVDQYGVSEPTIQRSGIDRIMVQLPDVTNLETVKDTIGSVAKLDFRLVADVNKPADETIELKNRDGGRVRLEDEILMTGDAIKTASVEVDPQNNGLDVAFQLNPFGKTTFGRITSDNVGRQLAIVLDNVVQSTPVIRSEITGGSGVIQGTFTREEAHRLAVVLRSGALPAPLTFEEERTVGATLGADAIRRGLMASAIGAGLVIVFMIGYYRRCGVLAVGCVTMAITFLLALLSLFGGTLTLPGIGGIALNVGMGVDASIIIFERIREELRVGSTTKAAIEAGFHKAWHAIMDSNVTTLIAGVVLYGWGTGPIKGFAVTLSLGVLTTMFCAIYVCKAGFAVLNLENPEGKLSI